MIRRLILKILLFEIIFLISIQSAVSQVIERSGYLPFGSLINQLESKFQVHFFYKSEWFEMKNLNSSILQMPFEEILEKLKSETDFSIITIDSVLYIFEPVKPDLKHPVEQKISGAITIGNSNEYGKYSKAVLQGRITDGMTGNILPGATLFIDKLKIGVMTDNNGIYNIKIPVGEYTVRLTFMGYDENSYEINLVGSGNLDMELYEKSIRLGEVIVTAEKPDLNVSGSQMSYIRLDTKSIKELPLTLGGSDVIKSLTLMPGVQTIGEFGTGFNVRGGGADQNLILLEDVPLFNASHLFGLTSVVNSDGISQVELFKAGIPAKYGDRASSVLDIRFGAENPDIFKIKGGIGLLDSRLYIETPVIDKKVSFLISARTSYTNWLLHKIPDIDLMNSSAHFYDVNTLLTYNLNSSDRISLFTYISNDRFGFARNTSYLYSNLLASVRWKHTFSNILYFNLHAGLSNYRFSVAESDTSRIWEEYEINSSISYKNIKGELSWFPLENHSVNLGLNSVFYTINPGEIIPAHDATIIEKSIMQSEKAVENAFFLSDNILVTSKLTLDFGLRFSFYSFLGPNKVYSYNPGLPKNRETIIDSTLYTKNKIICNSAGLEPRLSVRYSTSDNSSLKFSYNRIHQYVNLISNTSVMIPSDIWKLSTPNLNPITSDHFALGFFKNFKNNSIESSIEIYYKRLINAIDYKNGTRILLNSYLETDLLNVIGNNYGIEFYVRKNTGKLTGWLSYTLSKSLLKSSGLFEEEKINDNQVFPSNFDRPNNIVANFNWHLSRRWRLGGTFNYSTGRPVSLPEYKFDYQGYQLLYYSDRNKYRLPDYHRLDVSITYDKSLKIKKSWKGSWTLSVINLYGRKNAYSVFYKKEEHMVSNQYRLYDNYILYIIGIPFPMLTYNFSF